jgi:hypothetical protein
MVDRATPGVAVERSEAAPERARTHERRWSTAIIGVTLLPFAVSAIRLATDAGSGYHPYADQATIESLVRDVGHHWLLLGPFSRFGWFHPGPALYYLLALPYRLTGSSSGSLAFGALCINAGAVLGIMLIARRRGGLPLMLLAATFVLLLVRTLGAQFLRDPWNPYVTLLPFLLLLFVVWSAACGDRWAIPVALGVGSFLVQTHVGYALVVAVVIAAGVVGLVVVDGARRGEVRRSWLPTLAASAAVLVVFWLPVVVQQVTHDPGNVSKLVDFFGDHGQEQRAVDAWHVLALQLDAWPDWLSGASAPSVIGTVDFSAGLPIPVALLALVVATALTWRRAREAFTLDCIVLAALVATFVAMTRIVGEVLTYLVKWTWTLGTITWIAIAWSCVAVWRARRGKSSPRANLVARAGMAVLVGAFVVVAAVDVAAGARAGTPQPRTSAAMGRLGDAAFAALPDRPGVAEIRVRGGEGAYWASAGIADVLEHHGITVRVGPELEFAYGSHRLVGHDRVRAMVVVADKDGATAVRTRPGYRAVARDGDVTVFVGRAPR